MTDALFLWVSLTAGVWGHPLSEKMFDRSTQVVASPESVTLHYDLELTELTLTTELLALAEPGDIPLKADDAILFYRDLMAPLLARGFILSANDEEIVFKVSKRHPPTVEDHVRLRFEFQAQLPNPSGSLKLTYFDTNFAGELGYRRLALLATEGFRLVESTVPKTLEEAPETPTWEMTPEQELASTQFTAELSLPASTPTQPEKLTSPIDLVQDEDISDESAKVVRNVETSSHQLRELLEQSDKSWVWPVLLLTAFGFGMIHAIKPGHGKTLVAAYLVGQQGTLFHACLLGLITAATHTGSVMFVAVMLRPLAGTQFVEQGDLSFWLTLLSGLLIVSLGTTLLYRRLTGQEDLLHVHGAGGHVHLPDGSVQYLDESGQVLANEDGASHDHAHPQESIRLSNLLTLGISGGLIPCDDAVVLLLAAIGAGLLTQAVYILLAFSGGLAAVLVLLGILVVKVKGFAARKPSSGVWLDRLQVASAAAITVIGFTICVRAWV